MSVIVFNPNERKDIQSGEEISAFNTMENHCLWVYENVVKNFSPAKEIYFVSHSMGGYCTVDIMKKFSADLNGGKIVKIAFTDSVHGTRPRILDKTTYNNLVKKSINFVTSKLPAGEFISPYTKSYDMVNNCSAGHEKHEYTSGYARNEIFKFFFDEQYL